MSVGHSRIETVENWLKRASNELEKRVKACEERAIETVLELYPHLTTDRDSVLELIYLDYVLRQEAGEVMAPEAFASRFPEYRDEVLKLVQVDGAMRSADITDPITNHSGRSPDNSIERLENDSRLPHQIGEYTLLEVIGRGGMGVVYRARQKQLGRLVAVKTVDTLASFNPSVVARFKSEAELAARLQHPNIVQIYEISTYGGVPFFSMELVIGGTLAEATRDRPLQPTVAAKLVETLARAVGYAHSQGVVHRDLKPANVLLAPSLRPEAINLNPTSARSNPSVGLNELGIEPKIADFGLAKYLGSEAQKTVTAAAIGTPSYMAPEQVDKALGKSGPASDVYALGAILYDLLVGRPPFHAATALETMQQVRHDEPIPPRKLQSKVPQDLETICLTCLRKEPQRRYATADALADDLNRYLSGQSIKARSSGPLERSIKWVRRHPSLAALIAAVGIAALSTTWLWRQAELSGLAEHVERLRAENLVYARDISLAHLEYRSHHAERCEEILQNCVPSSRNWEWNYLKSLCEEHLWETPRHKLPILSAALSPDGKRLACSYGQWGKDQAEPIRVWDIQSRELLYELKVPSGNVHCLEFSPDGHWLLSSGFCSIAKKDEKLQGGVRVWDLADGSVRLALDDVNSIVARFLPDGRSFLVGTISGRVVQFSTDSGESIREFNGHNPHVLDISISSTGNDFFSSAKDRSLRHWDLKSGKLMNTLSGLADDPFELECSPDGKKVHVAGWNGSLITYDRVGWNQKLNNVQTHAALPHVCYSPDGQYLLTAVYGEGAELRDARSGKVVYRVYGRNGNIKAVAFDRSGRFLATGGSDGSARIWDLAVTNRSMTKFFTAGQRVSSIASNPVKSEVAVGTQYNHLRPDSVQTNIEIHDLEKVSKASQLVGHTDWPTSVAYSADGSQLISGSLDKTVRVWNLQSSISERVLTGHDSPIVGASFLENARSAVSVDGTGTIKVWDVEHGSERRSWTTNQDVTAVCLHANERHLAVGSHAGAIAIWDIETRARLSQVSGTDPVRNVLFSPDGKFLAITRDGSTSIELMKADAIEGIEDGVPLHVLQGHTDQVNAISFSRDGKRLVSSGRDESVRIYDHASGNELLNLHIARGLDNCVHFSCQNELIYTEEHRLYKVGVKATRDRSVDECFSRNNLIAWHVRQIQNAKARYDYYANVFHREHLDELQPASASELYYRGVYKSYIGAVESGERDLNAALALDDKKRYREVHATVCLNLDLFEVYHHDCQLLMAATKLPHELADVNDSLWVASLSKHSGIDFENWTKTLKALLERATRADPTKKKQLIAGYENTLGLAYYRNKDYPESIQHTKQSLKLGSLVPAVDYTILAMAHARLGEIDDSQACLDQATFWSADLGRREDLGTVLSNAVKRAKTLELPLLLREATEEVHRALQLRSELPRTPKSE